MTHTGHRGSYGQVTKRETLNKTAPLKHPRRDTTLEDQSPQANQSLAMNTEMDSSLKYREQHKERLNYMPWLYWSLKPKQREWARTWQQEWQTYLQEMETVTITGECFISPKANIFAERGRPIVIAHGSTIAAEVVLHGPISIGEHVSINHHATLDGGKKGIVIGNHCRIAAYSSLFAFNHGVNQNRMIREQPVTSEGIVLEEDVWLGAHSGITDGVTLRSGCVVGMHSVVTKNVASNAIVAGNPAKIIKYRD